MDDRIAHARSRPRLGLTTVEDDYTRDATHSPGIIPAHLVPHYVSPPRMHDGAVTEAPTGRTILHVDLDAFFAAVEQRDNPALRGKPVVVGGGGPNDRGVVSTASYEARVFGIRSAMPLRTAGALCPHAIFVPVNGKKYAAASKQVMEILRRFTPQVEQLSIDEAFLDVTGTEGLFGSGEEVARRIKAAVVDEVQLTISVGVASNRLVAKIASDLKKPDGLVVVPAGTEREFLAPLAIERLWGVGASTRRALADYNVSHDRRPRRTADGRHGPPLRRPRRLDLGAGAGESATRSWATMMRRSRSATSTRSTSTRTTGRSSSGRCSGYPKGSAAGCARRGSRRRLWR